jgi:hypothetical protein
MFVLFAGNVLLGKILFAASLLLLMWSLWLSVVEIRISVQALDLHLSDLEQTSNSSPSSPRQDSSTAPK